MPRVAINTAPKEEIAKLYRVGPLLAKRIVDYREKNGYFHGPDDLAKVGGIGLGLATLISSSIDWQIQAKGEPLRQRDWRWALICILAILPISWMYTKEVLPGLRYSLSIEGRWNSLWINASLTAAFFLICLFSVSESISYLIRRPARYRKINRANLYLLVLLLFSGISAGIGNAVYYQFYSPKGWNELWNNPAAQVAVVWGVVGFVNLCIIFVILKRPSLIHSVHLARILDTIVVILGPMCAFTQWSNADKFPIWIHLVFVAGGFYFAKAAFENIRKKTSFYKQFIDYLEPVTTRTLKRLETTAWLNWINIRLPDPEEQKALKRALDETYPPSRSRTAINIIVFGAGAWLIVTALGAIVEWIVQNWLGRLFK